MALNSQIERMTSIKAKLAQPPVLPSTVPMLIVCPKQSRLLWINAARSVGISGERKITCLTLPEVEHDLDTLSRTLQVVIIDETSLAERPRMREVVRAFGCSKLPHRLFMTADLSSIGVPASKVSGKTLGVPKND